MNKILNIGDRYLLKVGYAPKLVDISEYRVIEIAPSSNMVKLRNLIDGKLLWMHFAHIELVEKLPKID